MIIFLAKLLPKKLTVGISSIGVMMLWLNACNAGPKPGFTANDIVPALARTRHVGINLGFYPPLLSNPDAAALARAGGIGSIRSGLFHEVLEQYGYEHLVPFYDDCEAIGLHQSVGMLGFPAPGVRDTQYYCSDKQSALFAQLYAPIWDDGAHNTPVNDENPYALYVWKVARAYKGKVRIYEIWNEPDAGAGNGWMGPEQAGNWWTNPPTPCELNIAAPVFHYIRMLRISYEVIKSIDPDALVAVGGLGWPSFLDAICRYSDEPGGGKIVPGAYPWKGGAYFDCMSFHAYPHLLEPSSTHSDAASDAVWTLKNKMEQVLRQHGYDQRIYPAKHWICTEFNYPRERFGVAGGSEAIQVNTVLKTLAAAEANGVQSMYLYALGDEPGFSTQDREFSTMGLYTALYGKKAAEANPNELFWATRTLEWMLHGYRYDPERTSALQLPVDVRGLAFQDAAGRYTYMLWADTRSKNREDVAARYTFPTAWALDSLHVVPWHFSRDGMRWKTGATQVELSGSPLFLQ